MDIAAWLRELGLERYGQAFRENEIDAEILPKLTADDLKDIGVTTVGHRRKLLEAIAALAKPALARQAEPSAPAEGAPTARPAEAERRQLTVLFCDLVGSTELARRLDPEDLREVMRAYQAACAGVIVRFEGHVAKFLGDGVLAYFGWPRAHEDDAERAVRAGLALVEAVGQLASGTDAQLTARVGIGTGQVVVGDLISPEASDKDSVIGETPSLAARLQTIAEPGSVVISKATRLLVGRLFELDDLGPQRLKGFVEPLTVWRVIGEGAAESRFEALRGGQLVPLVGRDKELQLLLARWRRAKRGEGQLVLLSGEPGIGKSRLVRELREELNGEAYTPLSHYCSPYHVNSALYPVIGLLQRAATFAREDTAEQRLTKLKALLAQGSELLDEALPLVATLLSIPTDERYAKLDLTPQRQKQRTFEVLLEQLEGLARRQPVLAVYEDLHWVDPSTLELLGMAIDRVQRLPVLMVLTFRPEFIPPWIDYAHVTRLSLSRLARRHGQVIVDHLTEGKPLPAPVVEQIVARTDGVPLFVEELTKAVLETGLVSDAGDRYALDSPAPSLAIPSSLHDSLMARLDRLAPVKEVAQIGAVIGREFSYELLAAVADRPEAQLYAALNQLFSAELIFRRGTPPNATYTFKHALVQDAAYHSVLKSRRQQMHGRIAVVLEKRFADTADTQPELVAHHYTQAGLVEKAIEYWHKAGERAGERSAHIEAMAHLRTGLDLLGRLPETLQRTRDEIQLQMMLGISLIAVKGYAAPEVGAAYSRARELCEHLDERAHLFTALWGLWAFHQFRMELWAARELSDELLRRAGLQGDNGLLLQAHHAAWTTSLHQGEPLACLEHARQGIALYNIKEHRSHAFRYGGHDPGACCRRMGADALWLLGYPDQAVEKVHEGLAIARELAHPLTIAFAIFSLTFVYHYRREPCLAREQADALVALCAERGIGPHLAAVGIVIRGWAMAAEGSARDGEAEARRGVDAMRATGTKTRWSYYLAILGDACGRAAHMREGLAAIAEALDFVEQSGERWWEAELHRLKGELLLACRNDNSAQAEACFKAALAVACRQHARSLQLRAATSLGRLWAEHGRRTEAHNLLAPIYGWFTEGFDTADLKVAKALLDELA